MDAPPGPPTPVSPPVDAAGEKSVRALGFLLVVLGMGLAAGTALIAFVISNAIAHGGQPGVRTRWNGNPDLTRVTFQIFAALFLFGLDALAAGIYQVRTGRRNPWLIGIMVLLLLAIPLFGLGFIITVQHSTR